MKLNATFSVDVVLSDFFFFFDDFFLMKSPQILIPPMPERWTGITDDINDWQNTFPFEQTCYL